MRFLALALAGVVALVVLLQWKWNLFRGRLHPWLEKNATLLGAYRSVAWLLTVPIILVGGYLAFQELQRSVSTPDVQMVFARPKRPVFFLINQS